MNDLTVVEPGQGTGQQLSTVQTSSGPVDVSRIPGWGVDADPQNDPTYPYRERDKDDHSGTWQRPPVQIPDVEVLQSIEHKQQPAVVGTTAPPSGLSGTIRRLAFTKSESNLLHWVLLLGADRVNMIEGVIEDFARGKLPNIPAERGIRSEWEFNKGNLLLKTAGAVAVVAIGATLLSNRQRSD